jgi:hypothetical protein
MTPIAKSLFALALGAAVLVPHAAQGENAVARTGAQAVDFQRYLPPLPADVPWLALTSQPTPQGSARLPEAGSLSAWLLVPKPVQAWTLSASVPFPVAGM